MDGWRKSSYSGGNGGSCVEVAVWRKSTYSGSNGGQCVEVGKNGVILVRDTTNRNGGTLDFTVEAWAEFTASLR
jgi:Domain of unknown function (DUF397)